ncbi:hypothetical protein [Roseovarius autotrophicus]|uniref:hypothetical protein n=1 Tax=Roseovarius autotrophicus TaxID=2824121 RepID=UPI001B385D9C|nr:hypothetical protein [Roseovarius autotrophicus]
MTDLQKHSQRTAAARAGFSERTARRFNADPTPPSKRKILLGRTVTDPLEGYWENDLKLCAFYAMNQSGSIIIVPVRVNAESTEICDFGHI